MKKTRNVTFTIPPELYDWARKYAEDNGYRKFTKLVKAMLLDLQKGECNGKASKNI